VPRPAELGPLEISVTPPPGLDAAGVRRYAELGVDRLVLLGMHPEEGRLLRFVEESATKLFPAGR
jgi:hypothetical protein